MKAHSFPSHYHKGLPVLGMRWDAACFCPALLKNRTSLYAMYSVSTQLIIILQKRTAQSYSCLPAPACISKLPSFKKVSPPASMRARFKHCAQKCGTIQHPSLYWTLRKKQWSGKFIPSQVIRAGLMTEHTEGKGSNSHQTSHFTKLAKLIGIDLLLSKKIWNKYTLFKPGFN